MTATVDVDDLDEEEDMVVELDASVPKGWNTSGPQASYRENQWVRHGKVWRDEVPSYVLQAGTTFDLGSDFTKCDVLVLAIGVFHQINGSSHSKRVTVLCSFKKDGQEWDAPQFHSASSLVDCAVALELDFARQKGVKPFLAPAVEDMCINQSGREIKNSSGFWTELQNSPKTSPITSKRSRSGTEEMDTQKPPKIPKANTGVPAKKVL